MTSTLHIAIFGNTVTDSNLPHVEELLELLSPLCLHLDIETSYYVYLAERISLPCKCRSVSAPEQDTTMIVSIGGDGTFLHAVQWENGGKIPVAGLNGGHLGYLTGWTLGEIAAFATAIASGKYSVEQRAMLQVRIDDNPPCEDFSPYALNEIAVLKECSANMIDVKAEIDGHYLADYQGDGLIVATPTGSTGYNLSTGGPILEPQLPVWVLSPVAPHSLNMRPLVVSAASCLHLVVNSRSSHVLLSMDGRSVSIPSGTSLTITAAPFSMPVVRPSGSIFATTLREKLYWGLVSGR